MEKMDKRFTVPKWVLIVWPKTPQMHKKLSDQFVCSSSNVLDFNEKRLHWVSVVRYLIHCDPVLRMLAFFCHIDKRNFLILVSLNFPPMFLYIHI